ncbi:MAG: hypothetical protein INQ03_09050 [Candidatus Heimdallarchaeota archaeon]|nr:hypothetical protein [Candidatus Heimdallarchaeota archaeon]
MTEDRFERLNGISVDYIGFSMYFIGNKMISVIEDYKKNKKKEYTFSIDPRSPGNNYQIYNQHLQDLNLFDKETIERVAASMRENFWKYSSHVYFKINHLSEEQVNMVNLELKILTNNSKYKMTQTNLYFDGGDFTEYISLSTKKHIIISNELPFPIPKSLICDEFECLTLRCPINYDSLFLFKNAKELAIEVLEDSKRFYTQELLDKLHEFKKLEKIQMNEIEEYDILTKSELMENLREIRIAPNRFKKSLIIHESFFKAPNIELIRKTEGFSWEYQPKLKKLKIRQSINMSQLSNFENVEYLHLICPSQQLINYLHNFKDLKELYLDNLNEPYNYADHNNIIIENPEKLSTIETIRIKIRKDPRISKISETFWEIPNAVFCINEF